MADDVQITNVPNGLISTKNDKNGKAFSNIRLKYEASVGGNGYGVLRVPADTITEVSPKFSKVTLDKDKRYGIFYTNGDGQRRTDWMYASDVKKAFDATRAPKAPTQPAATTGQELNTVTDYDDLDF